MSIIRLSGIIKESITDGPGIRLVLFTQGCPHKCRGCHNPETWSSEGGKDYDTGDILKLIDENPLLNGVTFSGGEPLIWANELLALAIEIKERNKNIVCYTGFILEDLLNNQDKSVLELFKYIDILIDGPFVLEKKDLTGRFTGSSNQRVIKLPASLKSDNIILFTE